jgi:hypothetical protein
MTERDLADTFCELYDRYQGIPVEDAAEWRGASRSEATLLAHQLEWQGFRTLDVDVGDPGRAITTLLALEKAIVSALPRFADAFATSEGWRIPLARRYARTGTLQRDASGALLPRWHPSARNDRFSDLFLFLVRLGAPDWKHVRYSLLAGARTPALAREPRSGQKSLPVACAPFADDLAELDVVPTVMDDRPAYWVGPGAALKRSERIAHVLEALDESDAVLGVLPEGCLDDELLERWRALLDATPIRGPLRWLLLGSGPSGPSDPKSNTAVIVARGPDDDGHRGQPLLVQSKRHGFTIENRTIAQWCLEDRLPGDQARVEAISTGDDLAVLETDVGRFCVLICEDLAHFNADDREAFAAGTLAEKVGVSHVLVPIFDRELKPGRWHAKCGVPWSREAGARVLVATSLAVARARQRHQRELVAAAENGIGSPDLGLLRTHAADTRIVHALVLDPDFAQDFEAVQDVVAGRWKTLNSHVETLREEIETAISRGAASPALQKLLGDGLLNDMLEDAYVWFDGPSSCRWAHAQTADEVAVLNFSESG